jgi:predicted dehydrogenase
MAPVRIALIGAGGIGKRHLEAMKGNPDYVVAAIADPSPAAALLAKEAGYPYFDDFKRALDETKPDGAIVATPNQQHVVVGLACVARGIPVLVEKPIADSVAQANELVSAGAKAGVPILTGHHRRHAPILRRAAQAIGDGAVGRVTAVSAVWLCRKSDDYYTLGWRKEPGGGPVLINSIHDVDCLRMLCGDIDTVQAMTANGARNFVVEDTAGAVLHFKSGAIGTLLVSDAVPSPWTWERGSYENSIWPHESENCYLIAGTHGTLSIPSLELWSQTSNGGWMDPLRRDRFHYIPADVYAQQMHNFAEVIRGQAQPVMSGAEGARTLATTLAIAESAKTGKPVRVDDLMKG